jgi:hypothetical protein
MPALRGADRTRNNFVRYAIAHSPGIAMGTPDSYRGHGKKEY